MKWSDQEEIDPADGILAADCRGSQELSAAISMEANHHRGAEVQVPIVFAHDHLVVRSGKHPKKVDMGQSLGRRAEPELTGSLDAEGRH